MSNFCPYAEAEVNSPSVRLCVCPCVCASVCGCVRSHVVGVCKVLSRVPLTGNGCCVRHHVLRSFRTNCCCFCCCFCCSSSLCCCCCCCSCCYSIVVAVAWPKFVFVSLLNFALERSATNDIRTASYFLIYSQLLFVHQTPGWSCLLLTPVPHPPALPAPPAAGRVCVCSSSWSKVQRRLLLLLVACWLSLVGCWLLVAGCLPVVSCR